MPSDSVVANHRHESPPAPMQRRLEAAVVPSKVESSAAHAGSLQSALTQRGHGSSPKRQCRALTPNRSKDLTQLRRSLHIIAHKYDMNTLVSRSFAQFRAISLSLARTRAASAAPAPVAAFAGPAALEAAVAHRGFARALPGTTPRTRP